MMRGEILEMSDFGCGVWVVGLWCGVLWDCGVGCCGIVVLVVRLWCRVFGVCCSNGEG